MKSALVLIDNQSNKVYHVIVSNSKSNLEQFIEKSNNKTEYKIIEDWDIANEAIKFSNKYGYQTI